MSAIYTNQKPIAQLEAELAQATNCHAKIDLLNELSAAVRYSDMDYAIVLAEQSQSIAVELNADQAYPQGLADSLNNLCWYSVDRTRYTEAHSYATEALSLYRSVDDRLGEAQILGRLGRMQLYWGNYSDALDTHFEQLKLSEAEGDIHEAAKALNNLGNIYARLHNLSEALTYYGRAQALFADSADKHLILTALLNISYCYIRLNQLDDALEFAQNGLDQARAIGNQHFEGGALQMLGEIFAASGDIERAKQCMLQHIALAIEISNEQQQLDSLLNLAQLLTDNHEYDHALSHLHRARTIAESAEMKPHLYRSHRIYADLYKAQGNFEQALTHFEQFHLYKEMVFSEESDRKFQELEKIHKTAEAEQEAEIYRLQTVELEMRVAERTQELGQVNAELRDAVAREIELNQIKSQMISTISHEFRTPLTTINNSADLLIRYSDKITDEKRAKLHERIHTAIFSLSDLLNDVTLVEHASGNSLKADVSELSFSTLCEQLAQDLTEHPTRANDIKFSVVSETDKTVTLDYNLFKRCALNLLSNAVTYSEPNTPITIEVGYDNGLQFAIRDEGIGIPAAEIGQIWDVLFRASNVDVRRGLGLGLYTVKKLVTLMDGEVSAESTPAATTISINFPV